MVIAIHQQMKANFLSSFVPLFSNLLQNYTNYRTNLPFKMWSLTFENYHSLTVFSHKAIILFRVLTQPNNEHSERE